MTSFECLGATLACAAFGAASALFTYRALREKAWFESVDRMLVGECVPGVIYLEPGEDVIFPPFTPEQEARIREIAADAAHERQSRRVPVGFGKITAAADVCEGGAMVQFFRDGEPCAPAAFVPGEGVVEGAHRHARAINIINQNGQAGTPNFGPADHD